LTGLFSGAVTKADYRPNPRREAAITQISIFGVLLSRVVKASGY